MAKVFALFDSDREVSAAVTALADAGFEDLDYEIIDTVKRPYSDDPTHVKMAPPVPGTSASLHTPATIIGEEDAVGPLGLSDEEAAFYRREIAEGGVLMVVDTSAGKAEEIRELLRQQGAEFADKS